MGHSDYNPDRDIPSQKGKIIFITGGTAGLGREVILALTRKSPNGPAHIYFTGRNTKAAAGVIADARKISPDVPLTFIEIDMLSLASVKAGMAKFTHDRLDVLMCNAGIMATPPGLSKDGFEEQFAVNYLSHAVMMDHLLPVLRRTGSAKNGDARIIYLTSVGYAAYPPEGINFDKVRTTMESSNPQAPFTRYGQGKLAGMLYCRKVAELYPEVTAVSVHPGVVATGLVNDLRFSHKAVTYVLNWLAGTPILKPEEGYYSQIWCLSAKKEELVNGGFYMPIGQEYTKKAKPMLRNDKLADELWDWTKNVLAKY